jgi:hypothetical protein
LENLNTTMMMMMIWTWIGLGYVLDRLLKLQSPETTGYYELKQYKPWFRIEYSKLLGIMAQLLIMYFVFVRHWTEVGIMMGNYISYLYRFWEGLCISEQRSIVQYSHWILYTYKICYGN